MSKAEIVSITFRKNGVDTQLEGEKAYQFLSAFHALYKEDLSRMEHDRTSTVIPAPNSRSLP